MGDKKKKKKTGKEIHIGTPYEGDIIKLPIQPIYDKNGNRIIIHVPAPEIWNDGIFY